MAAPAPIKYNESVFINCPFDAQYTKLLYALVFAVTDCGFVARCALEEDSSGVVRVHKILQMIKECRIGIHDISRTETSPSSKLPRFNMPLELGMFLGAKEYGTPQQRQKTYLVLDKEPYRYKQFISDIGGQDIKAHQGKVEGVIKAVRNYLANLQPGVIIPGPANIQKRYQAFTAQLPALCRGVKIKKGELTFVDYCAFVETWLANHPRP